jgi:type 1 glutamine amidotransferase
MVVVNGDDLDHDLLTAATVFQQLGVEAGFATRRAMGTNRFVDPGPATADADVYLLYTAGGQFTIEQQQALAGAVAAGKGLLGVHGANVLRAEDQPLCALLGSHRFDHGAEEGRYRVRIVGDHPVTRGVADFDVHDEYGDFALADDVTVLARCGELPVLYTREVGAGRVVFLALGHDMRSWGEPAVRALVRNAFVWAAHLDGTKEDMCGLTSA